MKHYILSTGSSEFFDIYHSKQKFVIMPFSFSEMYKVGDKVTVKEAGKGNEVEVTVTFIYYHNKIPNFVVLGVDNA